jgi:uncharacterized protein (DUF608 family)
MENIDKTKSDLEMRLFPPNLLHAKWVEFTPKGYHQPVTGVIYRGEPRPTCGMPLGGLDTGCIDIEPDGILGYSTIFNHLIRPRLLLNVPFLGLHCSGKTWVLITEKRAKEDTPRDPKTITLFPPTDYTPVYHDVELNGVEIADSIDYWGHYPIVDMEFNTNAPVQVGLRAWSPLIPGDVPTSLTPGAIFELQLRNTSSIRQKGTLAFNFPGFELPPANLPQKPIRKVLQGDLNGVLIESSVKDDAWELGYVLAAVGAADIRQGGPLNWEGKAWAEIGARLPETTEQETGTSLAVDFELGPQDTRVVSLVFTWHAPHWRAGGAPAVADTNLFTHMYAKYYTSALTTAQKLARQQAALLKRIIAWQEAIYSDAQLPGWLADALINIFYLVPECSIWGQAKQPLSTKFKVEDGLFALNECPRGCPQFECIPCSFYGNIPVVYFFPQAALSTLRGYKAYQFEDGRPPWIFGGITAREEANKAPYELAHPDLGYQTVLNGACYVVMVDRYWRSCGDNNFLAEFWSSLKRCNDFSMNLRSSYGLSQVVAMPTPGTDNSPLGDTEWFEAPEPGWKGYVAHAGGVRMAEVAIMRRMAEAMNDLEYVKKCDDWLQAGSKALEEKLWAGSYYLNFNEPETGQKSDLIFGYQLDGQWITDWHGLPGAFPKERVEKTLETIRNANCKISQTGATNYANPDGTPAKVGGYGPFSYFTPELFMLAMTYIYEGQRDYGLYLLRRCLENVVRWGYMWDYLNMTRGDVDSGQRGFGADYYQNMMLWALPAALAGQDLSNPCQPGGLVQRVISAGQ